MAMTHTTTIYWDHDMSVDADFNSFAEPLLTSLVSAGATDNISSSTTGIPNGDGNYAYSRNWDSEANANSWISTVNSKTGYVSSTVTPIV